ncbi:MAG: metallophosphoesterase [Verrucomicrobiota bacterium]
MKVKAYDLIGDIHGQYEKLLSLLELLGYRSLEGTYRHPEGRTVIFLGDYIDRGPKVREVLHTVRAMVEAGDALAIMGNHEYNAVCYHTPKVGGGWLRERTRANTKQIEASLCAFDGRESEWTQWLEWMRKLPLFLDLGELRVVHACWDAPSIQQLDGQSIQDDGFLQLSGTKGTAQYAAVETVLKGPELDLPEGYKISDNEGRMRKTTRVRWWDLPEVARFNDLAMRDRIDAPDEVDPELLSKLPNYGRNEPPVFFGHYSLNLDKGIVPIRGNLACLDFGGGYSGPLLAYRWDGEAVLTADKFVSTYNVLNTLC